MIFKLFSLPIRTLIKIGEKIQEEADQELYNIPYIQQQLIELHMMYEMEEIDEETYVEREEELLNRYKIAKEREKNELLNE
ncbi:gas vesicle protein GvpG [Bacillus sp. UNC41MFS5]|uniref:gas vesicle protein GvpG n=1 Tax=Bacillus sp. UNC41MFS5 TaxID=1449046 RepID=UPI0004789870|nr:gas vesicle protein GvpG [Bacillus sp. UNC41MFS5]